MGALQGRGHQHLVRTPALVAVIGHSNEAGDGVVRQAAFIPWQVDLGPGDHLLEPVPLGIAEVLDEAGRRPARRDHRSMPRFLVEAFDDRQHRGTLVLKEIYEIFLLRVGAGVHKAVMAGVQTGTGSPPNERRSPAWRVSGVMTPTYRSPSNTGTHAASCWSISAKAAFSDDPIETRGSGLNWPHIAFHRAVIAVAGAGVAVARAGFDLSGLDPAQELAVLVDYGGPMVTGCRHGGGRLGDSCARLDRGRHVEVCHLNGRDGQPAQPPVGSDEVRHERRGRVAEDLGRAVVLFQPASLAEHQRSGCP